jgi:FKBP-type peptidyl-prolyl cis-trans isomerase
VDTRVSSALGLLGIGLVLACAGRGPAQPASPVALESEEDRIVYALGLLLAEKLEPYHLQEREIPLFQAGLTEGLLGQQSRIEIDTRIRAAVDVLASKRQEAELRPELDGAAALLAAAEEEEGAVRHPSGIVIRVISPGDGPVPGRYDWVKVHYRGTLRDGTVFEDTREGGEPVALSPRLVFPCLSEALQLLAVGSRARVVCPPDLAYGLEGLEPSIPPGAALDFDLELIELSQRN